MTAPTPTVPTAAQLANPAQVISHTCADVIAHVALLMEHVRQANAAEGDEVALHKRAAVQHAKQARLELVQAATLLDGFVEAHEDKPRIQRV